MPGAFTSDFNAVRSMEATTDVTAVGSLRSALATDDDFKIEQTNSLKFGVSSATGTGTASILALTQAANQNWAGAGYHFYIWAKVLVWSAMALQRRGGLRVAISSDAPPTAIRSVLEATVTAGGTGYTLNDVLTLVGGTGTAAQVRVTGVSGGVVTSVSPVATARGAYTILPTNPISTTGGTGTGCTLNVAGTGQPPDGWIYGLTNAKEWFVGGNDTALVEGWVCYVVDVDGTPDLDTGGAMSSVDRAGTTYTCISVTANRPSQTIDVCRYGTGLTVNDGTSGSPVTLEDIRAWDNANARALGVLIAQSGVYFLAGKIRIGTSGQSAETYFKDTDKVIVCQPFPVNTQFYEIVLAGNTSPNITTFQLGNLSGGVASGGVLIRGALRYTTYGGVFTGYVPSIWTLTAGAVNTLIKLYGCTFQQMRRATLRSDSDVQFCTFQDFGDITAAGATLKECTFLDLQRGAPISATYAVIVETAASDLRSSLFINAGGTAAVKWNVNADPNGKLDDCEFTMGASGHAIEFGPNTPGDPTEITLAGVAFTGYGANETADAAIYNNSGKHLIINVPATCTVRNGAGASTTLKLPQLALTLTGLIVGSEVRIYNQTTGAELAGTESSGTSFTYLFTSGGVTAYIHIIKYDYEFLRIQDIALDDDKTIPIQQRFDRVYAT